MQAAQTLEVSPGVRSSLAERPTKGNSRERAGLERDNMAVQYLPLVRRLCGRFRNSGEPMDDLFQIGSVGLLKAIDKYDPELGSNFMAFAVPVIVGEIKNYFRDHGWSVRIPRKLQSQRMAVERAVEPLTQALGRRPTVTEIAEATGLAPEEIHDTFEVEIYGKPLSLNAEYQVDDGEDSSSLLDYLGGKDPEIEAVPSKLVPAPGPAKAPGHRLVLRLSTNVHFPTHPENLSGGASILSGCRPRANAQRNHLSNAQRLPVGPFARGIG